MNLPEPYASLELLPKHLFGWFTTEKELERLWEKRDWSVVVELGSWLGASTVWFARHAAKVYAVDTWLGSIEHTGNPAQYTEELITLYPRFLSNMVHEEVAHKVVPLRMTTRQAALCLKVRPDFVFVDAAHDAQSVYEDIMVWQGKLSNNKFCHGMIAGDDWNYQTQGPTPAHPRPSPVQVGVKAAARDLGCEIKHDGNLWWLEP